MFVGTTYLKLLHKQVLFLFVGTKHLEKKKRQILGFVGTKHFEIVSDFVFMCTAVQKRL